MAVPKTALTRLYIYGSVQARQDYTSNPIPTFYFFQVGHASELCYEINGNRDGVTFVVFPSSVLLAHCKIYFMWFWVLPCGFGYCHLLHVVLGTAMPTSLYIF